MAAYLVKDNNPQYGGMCYFVGTRRIKDPQGRDCEAADFGDKSNAKKFSSKSDAASLASNLNKMAGCNQFVVEEESIYMQQYGRPRRQTPGFTGFGRLPEPSNAGGGNGGFRFIEDEDSGYNGF